MIFTMLLASQTSLAGDRWLYNDGFSDNSEIGFQGGFVSGECWASLYTPDSGDYPFTLTSVRVLVGGATSKQIFTVSFYNPSGQDMSGATHLGSEGVALIGNDTSWNEITISQLELGTLEVSSGNVAVSICFEDHNGYPAIARDTDGMAFANGSWIYADAGLGASWYTSETFGLTGDWIMRLCIDSDNISTSDCGSGGDGGGDGGGDDTGSDVVGELSLDVITPAVMAVGEALDVVLIGSGFESGAEARIGGIPLVGQDVLNSETIQGRTPTTLPEGIHDVEVVLEDGTSEVLAGGFEVTDGKGCAHAPARGLGWSGLLLLPLVLLRRRPH